MRRLKLFFPLLFCTIYQFSLFAHPHVFIKTGCSLDFKEGKLAGLWVEFDFDKIFSSDIILGYDENGDGQFNGNETEEVYKNAFINLENYNFFTFIRHGEILIHPDKATDFSVCRLEGGIVHYRFYLPLPGFSFDDFYIAIYDETFFCDVRFINDTPEAEGTGIPPFQWAREANENFSVFYNPQGRTDDERVYEYWTLGLMTFIPEEIHIIMQAPSSSE